MTFARNASLLPLLLLLGCPPDDGSVPPPFPGLEPGATPAAGDRPERTAEPGEATAPTAADPSRTPKPGEPIAPTKEGDSNRPDPPEKAPADADPSRTPKPGEPASTNGEALDLNEPTPPPVSADRKPEEARVCLLLPRTGPARDKGDEMRRGVRVAQDELAKQTWRTRTLRFEEFDTKSTEVGANTAFEGCVGSGHSAAIGVVDPGAVTAMLPVAAAHETLLIVPEVGSAVPTVWNERLIAVAPPSADMGRVAAKDAVGRSLAKVGVLHPAGTFGEGLRDAFVKAAEAEGGTVLGAREVDVENVADWIEQARALATAGAQALFVVAPGPVAEQLANQLDSEELDELHLWLIDWAMFPPVLEKALSKAAVDRVHWVNRRDPIGAFAETFQSRYQARPRYEAGSAYDAVLLAADAIEDAQSLANEDIVAAAAKLGERKSAFGVGTLTEVRGLRFLDVGGYGVVEGVPDPDSPSGGWRFGTWD